MAAGCNFQTSCSQYVKNLDSKTFDRYKSKLQYCHGVEQIPDPYSISEGWKKEVELWPDLTYGDIYEYLIETPGQYTKESLKAYKSLEAYSTFTCGHVKEVSYHSVADSCPFCLLKAQVIPSQRLRDKPHEAWVCLKKQDGSVYCAHCTCMAGLGEVCSHVAAVLFKIQTAVMLGLTKRSSTSEACRWNKTFRENINPKSVEEFSHLLQRRKQPVQTVGFDPNPLLPSQETLEKLKLVCPKSVFFDLIPKLDPEETDSASEGEDEFHVMEPLTLLQIENSNLSGHQLEQKCKEVFDSIHVTSDQVKELEFRTREQAVCKLWFEHRRGRITGSKFHDVIVRRDSTPPDSLVSAIMGYNRYDLSSKKEVKWGVDHEDVARKAYIQKMAASHKNFTCRLVGFVVDDKKAFLGASADGIAACDCHGQRTVEIKCPYKHKDRSPLEAAQIDSSFCLDQAGNLKTSHKYYSQMQLQMHVNRVLCGDFVIYTLKELKVNEMIPYDKHFTQAGIKQSENFFLSHVLPEILTGKLELSLNDTSGNQNGDELNEDNDLELFCLCNQPEYGKMIACDNEDCDIVWFHYACVNVKRKPRGKWFCPDCKRDSSIEQ